MRLLMSCSLVTMICNTQTLILKYHTCIFAAIKLSFINTFLLEADTECLTGQWAMGPIGRQIRITDRQTADLNAEFFTMNVPGLQHKTNIVTSMLNNN